MAGTIFRFGSPLAPFQDVNTVVFTMIPASWHANTVVFTMTPESQHANTVVSTTVLASRRANTVVFTMNLAHQHPKWRALPSGRPPDLQKDIVIGRIL